MNVVLAESSNDCSVWNVHVDRPGTLSWSFKWKLKTVLFYLVIEAPLGGNTSVDQEVVDALTPAVMDGKKHEYPLAGGRTCVLYLKPKYNDKKFDCPRSHASYAVYACGFDRMANQLAVYVSDQPSDASCDVPGTIRMAVAPHNVTETTGLFKKKTETRRDGYTLRLEFDSQPAPDERLGVWYEFPGSSFRYPILPAMDGKTLNVKSPTGSDDRPQIKSSGIGYTVVEVK